MALHTCTTYLGSSFLVSDMIFLCFPNISLCVACSGAIFGPWNIRWAICLIEPSVLFCCNNVLKHRTLPTNTYRTVICEA